MTLKWQESKIEFAAIESVLTQEENACNIRFDFGYRLELKDQLESLFFIFLRIS